MRLPAIALAIALAGCAAGPRIDDSKLWWDNVRRIEVGMTADEVSKILGPPADVVFVGNVERRTYRYTALNGQSNWVTIPVRGGRVVAKPQTTPMGTIR